MTINTHPYTMYNPFENSDTPRSASERLEPAREKATQAIRYLEKFIDIANHARYPLTDEQLQTICDAAEVAYNAARNAADLGYGDDPLPVMPVRWYPLKHKYSLDQIVTHRGHECRVTRVWEDDGRPGVSIIPTGDYGFEVDLYEDQIVE